MSNDCLFGDRLDAHTPPPVAWQKKAEPWCVIHNDYVEPNFANGNFKREDYTPLFDHANIATSAARIAALHARILLIEAWKDEGERFFSERRSLGTMFSLGRWWGERPWRKP